MLDGHDVTIERRQARCCKMHTEDWVICICGWEYNTGLSNGGVGDAITAHRLTVIEDVLNEKHREGKRLRSSGPAKETWL